MKCTGISSKWKKPQLLDKVTIVLALISVWACLVNFKPVEQDQINPVDKYYLTGLDNLKQKLSNFKMACKAKAAASVVIQNFYQCRLAYKTISIFIDYFNPYETKLLNSPPIPRVEFEISDEVIPPKGFQAIEETVFKKKYGADDYTKIARLLTEMEEVIVRLKNEPDRIYKFRPPLVWDAMRSALVGMMTTGITGFDSPVANYSIPEASATIEGIKKIVSFYKLLIEKKAPDSYDKLLSHLFQNINYLKSNNRFNEFDRMKFIIQHVNPLYKILVQTRINSGIAAPDGKAPLHVNTTSIFNLDAFDTNFYSPPRGYWVTADRVQLGKLLFADPILSGSGTRSCASCHQLARAFTDGIAKPFSLDNKTQLERNTPTLLNAGFQTKQFYDSRADILENQLDLVVHNVNEMEGSLKKNVSQLKEAAEYKALFAKAYPDDKEPVSSFNIANAISSYVRSLRSLNSRFDQYMRGDNKKLNRAEINGFNLFMGKAKCGTCHFMPLFNGVVPPSFTETESEVLGVPQSKDKMHAVLDSDLGKYALSKSNVHKHAFKIPTLRNIELTAPYMHNGIYDSLQEVMEFYNHGGGKGLNIAPENQTLPFDKLNLSQKEIDNIIAFLKTLTDTSAVNNMQPVMVK